MKQNLPTKRPDSSSPAAPTGKAFPVSELGLRDWLSAIFKHKSMIFVSFVMIAGLSAVAIVFYMKLIYQPLYEAKALLLVKPGWESQSIDLSLERRQQGMNGPDFMATELRILQSRELKEKIISKIKPGVIFPDLQRNVPLGLPPTERALYRFEKDFWAKTSSGNIIEVAFRGVSPATTAHVINELVDSYIDRRVDYYRNPKAFLFLDKKTEEYKQKLSEAEDNLKAFQDQTKIISFDEQRTFLLNKQRQLSDAYRDNETLITQLQEKTSELEKQLPLFQKTTTITSARAEMELRLLNLELQEKDLLSKYKEDNHFITSIREQIALTKKYLSSQAPVLSDDPAYLELKRRILDNKAELGSLKIKQKELEELLKDVGPEISSFESQESKFKQLSRDVAGNEDKYKTYLAKLEEARIHDELDRQKMTSVSVLEPASVPIIPTNLPRPLLFYVALILFFGIGGSIGLALFLEILSPAMSTPGQAERRLQLPVLAVVGNR